MCEESWIIRKIEGLTHFTGNEVAVDVIVLVVLSPLRVKPAELVAASLPGGSNPAAACTANAASASRFFFLSRQTANAHPTAWLRRSP